MTTLDAYGVMVVVNSTNVMLWGSSINHRLIFTVNMVWSGFLSRTGTQNLKYFQVPTFGRAKAFGKM